MQYLPELGRALAYSFAVSLATMALLLGIEIGRTPLQIVASTGAMFWFTIMSIHYLAVLFVKCRTPY